MFDHSSTYRKFRLKNLPHKIRLNTIFGLLENIISKKSKPVESFLDVGCSTGYITSLIRDRFKLKEVTGCDFSEPHLDLARQAHNDIQFFNLDLNAKPAADVKKYDLITCFETLEHVGNLDAAITNILNYANPDARILISVPIEIKGWGTVKYMLKRVVYGYTFEDLEGIDTKQYFRDLLKGNDISVYRDPKKEFWSTHFGFDYRKLDKAIASKNVKFTAKNKFTTRFYFISAN